MFWEASHHVAHVVTEIREGDGAAHSHSLWRLADLKELGDAGDVNKQRILHALEFVLDRKLGVADNKLGMRQLGLDVEQVRERGRADPRDLVVGEHLMLAGRVEAQLGGKYRLLRRVQRRECSLVEERMLSCDHRVIGVKELLL